MSLALLFYYLMLNMFRTLVHPSSGACYLFVELFHGFYCSGLMGWCYGVVWLGWCGILIWYYFLNNKHYIDGGDHTRIL